MAFDVSMAMLIAAAAHHGQKRHGGGEYITHIERVVAACEKHGEDAQIVAALHDVLEDTAWTLDHLSSWKIPARILDAVVAITKLKCVDCDGRGWREDLGQRGLARHRLRTRFPGIFSHEAIVSIVDTVCGQSLATETCRVCSGSGSEKREVYLDRVKSNPLAVLVKIEDARDNRDDDTGRPGMHERYTWVLKQLGVEE